MRLDSAAVRTGFRLLALGETGSTNAHALACARAGERGPLWITAQTQTAGRGRRGREWTSQSGNLFATLLLTDPALPGDVAQLSFVASLAVHDAIADCAPMLGPRLALKWPNDVLCGGAKLCGILLEGEGDSVVIGIGVNCISHPRSTAYPAIDLAAAGAHVTPDDLLAALSRAMVTRLGQWQRGEGFGSIRADWLRRARGIGERILVRLQDREISGRFEALDARGQLVLRLADGRDERVVAGDVFPLHDLDERSA